MAKLRKQHKTHLFAFMLQMHVSRLTILFLAIGIIACNRNPEKTVDGKQKTDSSVWTTPQLDSNHNPIHPGLSPELTQPLPGENINTGNTQVVNPGINGAFMNQVNAMTAAHNKKDYADFLRYAVLPGMSTNITHRNRIIEGLKREDQSLAAQGISIDSLVVLPLQTLAEKSGSYYALIPKKIFMRIKGKKHLSEGYLIGYTHDQGAQCYFIDIDNTSEEAVYQLLPDLEGLIPWPSPSRTWQLP